MKLKKPEKLKKKKKTEKVGKNFKKDMGKKKDKKVTKKKGKSKPKEFKLPIKLSNSKKKECNGNLQCLTGVEKVTINDIYGDKMNSFGSMLIMPDQVPKSKFKTKCKGTKRYKIYKNKPLKKETGFSLLELPKSVLKPIETEANCYSTTKTIGKRKDIGQKCKKDEDCLSNRCSSLKMLGIPGKCVIGPSPKSADENSKCIYEEDCKKGLTCKNKICVIKDDDYLESQKDKKDKKSKKGSFDKLFGTFKKDRSKSNNSNSNLFQDNSVVNQIFSESNKNCVSENDIAKSINSPKYISFKDNKTCDVKNCGQECKKGSYCYRGECYHISKKCVPDIECLSDLYYKNPNCCKPNKFCKTQNVSGREVSYCEPLENISNLKNGFYCVDNKNCKSGNCNKNLNKCMTQNMDNLMCDEDKNCVNHPIYGNKYNGCISNICYGYKNFPKKSRDLFDTCYKDKDCKNENCGKKKLPYSFMDSFDTNIKKCVPKNKKELRIFNDKLDKLIKKQNEKLKKIKIVQNIESLENFDYIFYENSDDKYSESNRNNVVIFKKGNKYLLGKLVITKNNRNEDVYIILYFDDKYRIFNEVIGNFRVITSDNYDDIYSTELRNQNKSFNKEVRYLWHKNENVFKIKNKMIFEYICLMFFGKNKIILSKDNYSNKYDYYQFDEKYLNFEDGYDTNLNVFNTLDGDSIILSLPFMKDKYIRPVENNISNINFRSIRENILNVSYVNLKKDEYLKLEKFGYFNLSLNRNGNLKKMIRLNRNNKKIVNINEITIYSVFESLIE